MTRFRNHVRASALALFTTALLFAVPVFAQESQPGDVCTGGQAGWFRQSGGAAPADGGHLLFCDGVKWVGLLQYNSTGDLYFSSVGAVALPDGTTGQRPVAAFEGMIRYNTTLNTFEGYVDDGTPAWEDLLGGSSSLWTDNTTHISYQDAHLIKTGQTLPAALSGNITRFIWYPNKRAFVGGLAYSGSGADANIGTESFAFGYGAHAPGSASVAFGDYSKASGTQSVAMGDHATASGSYAVAMGDYPTASGLRSLSFGTAVIATGESAMALGLGLPAGTFPIVSGASSFGMFMGDQSSYNLASANVFGLVGGEIMIDSQGSTPASRGCIRYNDTSDQLEYSNDCSSYSAFGGAATTPAAPDRAIQFNSGGAFAADASFVYSSVGNLGIGTSSPSYDLVISRSVGNAQIALGDTGSSNESLLSMRESFGLAAEDGFDLFYDPGSNTFNVLPVEDAVRLTTGLHIQRADGRVGIGTATPGALTHVNTTSSSGNAVLEALRLSHQRTGAGAAGQAGVGAAMTFNLETATNGTFAEAARIEGVFTDTTAASKDADLRFYTMGPNASGSTTSERMRIDSSGNVGINNTGPDVALDVIGSIEYTGEITDMSDARLKTDIAPLEFGHLSRIAALKPVAFRMKDDPGARKELGFIAQDVVDLYPELIKEDPQGHMSMNYIGLIAPMVAAMQEQQQELANQNGIIQRQVGEIEELRAMNAALLSRVEALEAAP